MQVRRKIAEKAKDGTLKVVTTSASVGANGSAKTEAPRKRSARWDQTGAADGGATPLTPAAQAPPKKKVSTWEAETPAVARWEETPARGRGGAGSETPGAAVGGGVTPGSTRLWDATPGHATPGHGADDAKAMGKRNRWDETPKTERGAGAGEYTPGLGSGWAETPRTDRGTDLVSETPTPSASKRRSRWDETPAAGGSRFVHLLTIFGTVPTSISA